MKVANLVLAGLLATAAGCAAQRPYSSSTPGGAASPNPIPDTTPHLGDPSQGAGGSGGSSFFRGTGPTLKLPEARRDELPLWSPRLSSRRQSTNVGPQTSGYRPSAAANPVSTLEHPTVIDESDWSRLHKSTDRRAIETMRRGQGPSRIAILGSLHGDETQSVALVDELARYFGTHPDAIRSATVLLVKTPNPDGFQARSPYNVHGVDLNRNFPSPNWKALPKGRAGSRAGSEAETRVIVRLLEEFRPTLLVHLKDSRHEAVINSEGAGASKAEQMARLVKGQSVEGLGARTSGSVESYARSLLNCPSLTLLSAVEASDRAAWEKNREALLSLFGAAPSAGGLSDRSDDQPHPFDRPALRKSSLSTQRPATSPFERPTDVSDTRKTGSRSKPAEFPSAIPDHGYVELPPP